MFASLAVESRMAPDTAEPGGRNAWGRHPLLQGIAQRRFAYQQEKPLPKRRGELAARTRKPCCAVVLNSWIPSLAHHDSLSSQAISPDNRPKGCRINTFARLNICLLDLATRKSLTDKSSNLATSSLPRIAIIGRSCQPVPALENRPPVEQATGCPRFSIAAG